MTTLLPLSSTCNTDDPVIADAWSRIAETVRAMADIAVERGLADALAILLREDPLQAEIGFRDMMFPMLRTFLSAAIEACDAHEPSVEREGRVHQRVEATRGRAMTLFGPVEFDRCRYRPAGKGGSIIPIEELLGLTETGMTPAAAGLSMVLLSGLTVRECADVWERMCGNGPCASSLVRVAREVGTVMEDASSEIMSEVRSGEEAPEGAVSLMVSLDGVMVRMHEETIEGVLHEAGWREASCGVVSFVDKEGVVLGSRYFGRLPEPGKCSLKSRLSAEVFHWLERHPDLKLVAVADGCPDLWTFLEQLGPDVMVLDFYHAAEHLSAAADAAFGPGTASGKAWFETWRHILRHDPQGVGKTIDALRYLQRKGRGAEELRRVLGYFRNNRRRMNYQQASAAGFPIASGAVEAANKMLVATRMKRGGQRWGREGGQSILSFRALYKSGRFDRVWSLLAPRLGRGGSWKIPPAVNDNQCMKRITRVA